jgi:hypothetical protein
MAQPTLKDPPGDILDMYRVIVESKYPPYAVGWPILSGYNAKIGGYKGWLIVVFIHTGNPTMRSTSGVGELSEALLGAGGLDDSSKEAARAKLTRHFNLKSADAIVFVDPSGGIEGELEKILQRHERVMTLTPMRIFLSHKGADKPMVREYKRTLELLGFNPWLDEDAMAAGAELERALLNGFSESCAAVFFITPLYKDENYLASEVDYAIQERRKKGDRFAIISLVHHSETERTKVPDLLARYVWKEPSNSLDGLREIVRALPVQLGDVYWRP